MWYILLKKIMSTNNRASSAGRNNSAASAPLLNDYKVEYLYSILLSTITGYMDNN